EGSEHAAPRRLRRAQLARAGLLVAAELRRGIERVQHPHAVAGRRGEGREPRCGGALGHGHRGAGYPALNASTWSCAKSSSERGGRSSTSCTPVATAVAAPLA